jgi:hypothetical protein
MLGRTSLLRDPRLGARVSLGSRALRSSLLRVGEYAISAEAGCGVAARTFDLARTLGIARTAQQLCVGGPTPSRSWVLMTCGE